MAICNNKHCYMRNRITSECGIYTAPWQTLGCDVEELYKKEVTDHPPKSETIDRPDSAEKTQPEGETNTETACAYCKMLKFCRKSIKYQSERCLQLRAGA